MLLLAASAAAAPTPTPLEAFLAETFAGAPPAPTMLWYDASRRPIATGILGHPPAAARVRVWRDAGRCAVVLEEVPHSLPITAGFVVGEGRLERARVLVYRESRGGAVQRPAWLADLVGRGLDPARELDGPVDGLTGATLSVRAMTRMARLALYLATEAGCGGVAAAPRAT